jgi:hypothetical protein
MAEKKRNWKKDWENEKARQEKDGGVLKAKLARQTLRRKLDKEGVNRKGKDIAHKKNLSKGGGNEDFLASPSENRSFKRSSNHKPAATYDAPKKKK